jgi:hypothetical protein
MTDFLFKASRHGSARQSNPFSGGVASAPVGSSDADIEDRFERYAAREFASKEAALLEAKRFLVEFLSERDALRKYAEGVDEKAARKALDWRNDPRPPVPGDELPEGYVRR